MVYAMYPRTRLGLFSKPKHSHPTRTGSVSLGDYLLFEHFMVNGVPDAEHKDFIIMT